MLGEKLDKEVKHYLKAMREGGGVFTIDHRQLGKILSASHGVHKRRGSTTIT